MQEVSRAYKDGMKSQLRGRGYIKVSFDVVNQDMQDDAEFSVPDGSSYFRNNGESQYATLEDGFTRVDGSLRFYSQEYNPSRYARDNEAVLSNALMSEGPIELKISFPNAAPDSVLGMTLNFGDNYAVNFDIETDSGDKIEVRGNDSPIYRTTHIFRDVSSFTISFTDLLYNNARLRIYEIIFGIIVDFENDSVISSKLSNYSSPISETLPQCDFTIKVKNYDRTYDVDNPNSIVNFLEAGQKCKVSYGYELENGEVEWVEGTQLPLTDWNSDEHSATLDFADRIRSLDDPYVMWRENVTGANGNMTFDGLFYDMTGSSIIEYDESYYSENYFNNPMPIVSRKEALQIAANASMSKLRIQSDGRLLIEPYNMEDIEAADFKMERQDMTSYPNGKKSEPVASIVVSYYVYSLPDASAPAEELARETVQISGNRPVHTVYWNFPAYVSHAEANGAEAYIYDEYHEYYFCKCEPAVIDWSGNYEFVVYGWPYSVEEKQVTLTMAANGRTITWSNPLISTAEEAERIANWLADYYRNDRISYEYSTRGNPELDVLDVIGQENDYRDDLKVQIVGHELNFNGAFSGYVTAKSIGGDNNGLANSQNGLASVNGIERQIHRGLLHSERLQQDQE